MHHRAFFAAAMLFPAMFALAPVAQAATGATPIQSIVNIDLIPSDQEPGTRLLIAFVERMRQDPAVAKVTLIQQNEGPNHLILEESFPSSADYQRFVEADYVRQFRAAIFPHLGSPWDERLGKEIAVNAGR